MAPEDFDHAVIVKMLLGIKRQIEELKEELEDLRGSRDVNLEDLAVKIDNISTPGDDFGIDAY